MGIMATKEDGESRELRKLKEKVNVSLQMDASVVENSLSGARYACLTLCTVIGIVTTVRIRWQRSH
jgi:hypothetical protein